ncbi:hypothetical protein [Amycolatopsis pithecellobii]|uniref:hypothetical protein n=1 Tax=Amycolatopsis pithecellobii TaxID=664692 RepID=UPI001FE31AEB|nr:hypothetical protein [Amycolatopsis pithecellobii]
MSAICGSGGHPGNTGLDVIARQSRVADLLASGRMPSTLADVSGNLEPGSNYASSYLAPGEVLQMTWQGGGGYGDPLTRDPEAVARDVREERVTVGGAHAVYGVVLENGVVNEVATGAERARLREVRRDRSRVLRVPSGRKADVSTARRLDDNVIEAMDGPTAVVACGHCAEILGEAGAPDDDLALAVYEGQSTDAGPQIIADPADYIDAEVVFRQYCCPSCWTPFSSAVVPADHVTAPLGGVSRA